MRVTGVGSGVGYRGATLVFISSQIALQYAQAPGHAAYIASKAGLTGFADGVFAEVRHHGVRVCTIHPGLVNTSMGDSFTEEFGNIVNRNARPSDLVQPGDVAHAVVVACTPRASCFIEISVQPQRDLFRKDILTEAPQVYALLERRFGLPPPPARLPVVGLHAVAIVTGAGRGIGRVISVRLARLGFRVAIVARTDADLVEVEEACLAASPLHTTDKIVLRIPMDVTNEASLDSLISTVVSTWGTISAVVSNAGINRRRTTMLSDPSVWAQVINTNLTSSVNLTRLALPHLVRHSLLSLANGTKTGASLIFMNSTSGNSKQTPTAGIAPYFTSKMGLHAFADVVFEEVRNYGVRVSTIAPGLVNTELGRRTIRVGSAEKRARARGPVMPEETMIDCEDLADAVEYVLASSPTACPTLVSVETMPQYASNVRKHGERYFETQRDLFLKGPVEGPRSKL